MTPSSSKLMPDFCSRRHPFHYTTALNILRQMGLDITKINLLAVGKYENYKGEVRAQDPEPGKEISRDSKITLEIGNSSAVDYMPYQFFYGLAKGRESDRSWELRARKLMAPFEAAVIRYDSEAIYQKLKYDGGIINRDYLLKILNLFNHDISKHSEGISEILFWFSILPSYNYWTGNPALVEKVLKYFLEYDFKIVENTPAEYDIPEEYRYHLASKSGRLGRETIIGSKFSECDSGYELIVKGVQPQDVVKFMPGFPLRKKLDWLLSICMPSHLECMLKLKVKKAKIKVGRENKMCYLGYSSYL